MKKSCQHCGRIHDIKYECPSKPKRNRRDYDNRNEQRRQIKKFRVSAAWTKKRDEIQDRDLGLCQICIRKLYGTLHEHTYNRTSVHHIVPLVADWSQRLDNENLIVLCSQHHADAERGYIPARELKQIAEEQEGLRNK